MHNLQVWLHGWPEPTFAFATWWETVALFGALIITFLSCWFLRTTIHRWLHFLRAYVKDAAYGFAAFFFAQHPHRQMRVGMLGAILGFAIQVLFDIAPGRLARVLLESQLPFISSIARPSWLERTIDLISGPIVGGLAFLWILAFSSIERLLDRKFPAPPQFVRSDLDAERVRTVTDMEQASALFLEREDELSEILSFCVQNKTAFLWRAIVGPTGVGKTRLAIEWLERLRIEGWDVGFVEHPREHGLTIPPDWRPRRNTALVIDEAERDWSGELADTLLRLGRNSSSRAIVRVLVLGQIVPSISLDIVQSRKYLRGAKEGPSIFLGGLSDHVGHLLWTLSGGSGLDAQKLRRETAGRPRALLLMARARPGTSTYADALTYWSEKIVPALSCDPGEAAMAISRGLLKTLAISALAGPVSLDVARNVSDGVFEKHLVKPFFANADFENILPPFEPSDLGHEILLRALDFLDEIERPYVIDAALTGNPDAVEATLASIWCTRPEAGDAIRLWNRLEPIGASSNLSRARLIVEIQKRFDSHCPANVESYFRALNSLVSELPQLSSVDLMERLTSVEALLYCRPFDRSVREIEVRVALSAISHFGNAKRWDILERWGEKLRIAARVFGADKEIAGLSAQGFALAIEAYGVIGHWSDLERWGESLQALLNADPNNKAVNRYEARACYAAVTLLGKESRWREFELWSERIQSAVKRFPDDSVIRKSELASIINVIEPLGRSRRWKELTRLCDRIADNISKFQTDPEVCRLAAEGFANAMTTCAKAHRWDDVERLGKHFRLFDRMLFASGVIQLREATACAKVIAFCAMANHTDGIARWILRLCAIADAHINDKEIRLVEADGLVSVAAHLKNANQSGDFEFWNDRFCRVVEAFRYDRRVRLLEAKGAANIILHLGSVNRWDDLEFWGKRLRDVSDQFPKDQEVALEEARGATNAIFRYDLASMATDWRRRAWLERLAFCARNFLGSLEIQELAHHLLVTYLDQANAGWPYGEPLVR